MRISANPIRPSHTPQQSQTQNQAEVPSWADCFEQGSLKMCRQNGAIVGGLTGLAGVGLLAAAVPPSLPSSPLLTLSAMAMGGAVGAVCGAEINAHLGTIVGNWGASLAEKSGGSPQWGRAGARTAFAMLPL
ncbi:MAG: hypothetical protein KC910_36585, partial [Candidatus Eremiobacteraeota bacterium]|nr:hypothetical protein [Candidatus Eremiobacteraeota bacterium]